MNFFTRRRCQISCWNRSPTEISSASFKGFVLEGLRAELKVSLTCLRSADEWERELPKSWAPKSSWPWNTCAKKALCIATLNPKTFSSAQLGEICWCLVAPRSRSSYSRPRHVKLIDFATSKILGGPEKAAGERRKKSFVGTAV